jgi:hypothetical protein
VEPGDVRTAPRTKTRGGCGVLRYRVSGDDAAVNVSAAVERMKPATPIHRSNQ